VARSTSRKLELQKLSVRTQAALQLSSGGQVIAISRLGDESLPLAKRAVDCFSLAPTTWWRPFLRRSVTQVSLLSHAAAAAMPTKSSRNSPRETR